MLRKGCTAMGLDASVRCRCFEEGKLKPGPVPVEDLYIDEDGFLSSRTLATARKELDFRRFEARYHKLERAFWAWYRHCCEHENTNFLNEWVDNWAGCAHFNALVEEAGGEEAFPLLSNLLPHANDGLYPAEKAKDTLDELDRFLEKISDVTQWMLCDYETETEICSWSNGETFTWMQNATDEIGMSGGAVFFKHADEPAVLTTHFLQIPIGDPDCNGQQRMRIECLDSNLVTEAFDSLGPIGEPKAKREFFVTNKPGAFLFEGRYWTAESIRNLLVASIETGNPIQWC